jgi:hypothetical protein
MSTMTITVEATLQPDGVTLQLDKKVALPPGRVTVTVQPTMPLTGPTMLEVLDRIHRDQQQRGRRPMTEDEMAAEIAQLPAEGVAASPIVDDSTGEVRIQSQV